MADPAGRPWLDQDPAPTAVYVAHVRVRHHEADPLNHANNAAYLNYLEQAAIDHAAAAGFGAALLRERGGVFIARRHEIDYLRPAFAGDWLRVATWALSLGGARAHRAYQLSRLGPEEFSASESAPPVPPPDRLYAPADAPGPGGEILVRARTEWAFVDVTTGRPRRIPADLHGAFIGARTAATEGPPGVRPGSGR